MHIKNNHIACCLIVILLIACNSKRSKITTGYASFPGSAATLPISNGNGSAATPYAQTAGAIINQSIVSALNPEHGKPGHRCDIAVGAPLNSTAATATPAALSNPISNTPAATPIPAVATNSTSALNPEHGKPGHRCDIAVGAPLNSTAATATPTKQVVPAPVINTSTAKKNTSGLNPAHGEPGHRCDITVGAPLNSKPIVTPAVNNTSPVVNTTSNITNDTASVPATNEISISNVKPLINPPHGQAGHDCTIAVGKPLKQ